MLSALSLLSLTLRCANYWMVGYWNLLQVIEYIQFLQEKVHKYEGSYQGWSHEPAKLMPWVNFILPLCSLCNLQKSTLIWFLTSYYVFNDLFCVCIIQMDLVRWKFLHFKECLFYMHIMIIYLENKYLNLSQIIVYWKFILQRILFAYLNCIHILHTLLQTLP